MLQMIRSGGQCRIEIDLIGHEFGEKKNDDATKERKNLLHEK